MFCRDGGYRWNALCDPDEFWLQRRFALFAFGSGRQKHFDLESESACLYFFCPTTELAYQNVEVACSYRMRASSVICWGNVVFEEDYDKKVEALDILMKQYTDRPFTYGRPAVLNVKIWRVDIDEISCKEFGAPYRKAVGK